MVVTGTTTLQHRVDVRKRRKQIVVQRVRRIGWKRVRIRATRIETKLGMMMRGRSVRVTSEAQIGIA